MTVDNISAVLAFSFFVVDVFFPCLHEKPGAVDGLCLQSLVYVSKKNLVEGLGLPGVCVEGGGLQVAGA